MLDVRKMIIEKQIYSLKENTTYGLSDFQWFTAKIVNIANNMKRA